MQRMKRHTSYCREHQHHGRQVSMHRTTQLLQRSRPLASQTDTPIFCHHIKREAAHRVT